MKFWISHCLFLACIFLQLNAFAQDQSSGRHRVAVFVPLYLDSAFEGANNYRFDKSFPKFLSQGLEFYEGIQLALDSLQAEDVKIDVHIYDTRSRRKTVAQIIHEPDFDKTELIIGHVTSAELGLLAEAARHNHIPFINANFPNDGGIRNNPELVLLSSTLQTHCEAIYRFLQKNYATTAITVFRKKGALEDRLKNYFTDIEKHTAAIPLKLNFVTLDEPFTVKQILPFLDSTHQNVFVAASLDEPFAKNLCRQLAIAGPAFSITITGMPTWDNIDFSDPEYNGPEIVYTTPFYFNPTDNLVKSIQQLFKIKFYSRPSDMVFRGYETAWRFIKLLQQYGPALSGSIGEKKFKVFDDFDIQPVFMNKQNMTLDYFENKKLYFIKKTGGNVTAVY